MVPVPEVNCSGHRLSPIFPAETPSTSVAKAATFALLSPG
jgi:hypothetical protein